MSPNRVVPLTSNSTPSPYGCVATSEAGGGPGTEAFRAFDNTGTEWVGASTTDFIYYDFGSPKFCFDGVGLQIQTPNRGPQNFTIEGSNDALSWDVLLTKTGETGWLTNTMKDFSLNANNKRYRYMGVRITAVNGGTNTELEETRFYARDPGIVISGE